MNCLNRKSPGSTWQYRCPSELSFFDFIRDFWETEASNLVKQTHFDSQIGDEEEEVSLSINKSLRRRQLLQRKFVRNKEFQKFALILTLFLLLLLLLRLLRLLRLFLLFLSFFSFLSFSSSSFYDQMFWECSASGIGKTGTHRILFFYCGCKSTGITTGLKTGCPVTKAHLFQLSFLR